MERVDIRQAKVRLAELVEKAAAGEDVILTRGGTQIARITSLRPEKRSIRFGLLKGQIEVADDLESPLPDSVARRFEGR